VTSPTAYDYSPSFDPEGRFLYFLSRRALNPSMDPVQFVYSLAKYSMPYLVALSRGDSSPFIVYKKAEGVPGDVDVEGIQLRVEPFPVDEGLYAAVVGLRAVRWRGLGTRWRGPLSTTSGLPW